MELPLANLTLRHWNPGATAPLILPVHVVCNTSDDEIFDNIRLNSRLNREWVKMAEAHERVAVICGSGPSLADTLDEIRERVAGGAVLFALNGAAKFLADRGLVPEYQVILDARRVTAELVGPAREHLFASQVHPECFYRVPAAKLWHLQVTGIETLLPEDAPSHCLIGGAASVGNTATCLAYAMGFRELHLYGYDSSHRDRASHAFRQPMNDGEPLAVVSFGGKEYTASLTMKLQAEKFQVTAKALQDAGCKVEVHGSGLLPDMWRAPPEVLAEHEKYERLWRTQAYRDASPGEFLADQFMALCPDGDVLDIGCGTGRAAVKMANAGRKVTLIDFAGNARDPEAQALPFIKHDIRLPLPISAQYGFCCDVLEHLAPADVLTAVDNIMAATLRTFFQISTVPDAMGAIIKHDLHLTVRPHLWWRDLFVGAGYRILYDEEHVDSSILCVSLI